VINNILYKGGGETSASILCYIRALRTALMMKTHRKEIEMQNALTMQQTAMT
jgi:hypothetical protein